MRLIRAHRGQSTAEYAILFSIVIGAAIAMSQYVRKQMQGSMKGGADAYLAQAKALFPSAGVAAFTDTTRTSDSSSTTTANMTNMKSGTVGSTSNSTSTQTK